MELWHRSTASIPPRVFCHLIGMFLQCRELIKRVGASRITGMNQAHEYIPYSGAFIS